MPYPIPDNLDNIEGWRWYLVPLPDDDQMIQVAWGMWSELTHFWNWGKEGPVPEQSEKAAQLWAAALYEAWRIRDMGFPDIILTYIDEVEDLLRDLRANQIVPICCDDISQVDDVITTEVEPDVGDPPPTYGGEEIADWAAWRQHACGAANGIVDEIISKINIMNSYASLGFVTAAAVLALLTAFAQVGILALSVTGLGLTGAWYALTNGLSSWSFEQIATDVENARQDIICAVFVSAEAFEAAIQEATGLSWAFFSFYNWTNIRNAILEGSYGDQDLTVTPSTACDDCENPLPLEYWTTLASYGSGVNWHDGLPAASLSTSEANIIQLRTGDYGPTACREPKPVSAVAYSGPDAVNITGVAGYITYSPVDVYQGSNCASRPMIDYIRVRIGAQENQNQMPSISSAWTTLETNIDAFPSTLPFSFSGLSLTGVRTLAVQVETALEVSEADLDIGIYINSITLE